MRHWGGGGRSTAADRRTNATQEGEDKFEDSRPGKENKKASAQFDIIKAAVSEAVEGVGEMVQPQQQQESEWRRKADEADNKSGEIALCGDILKAHEEFTDKLEKQEAKDGGRGMRQG